MESFACLSYFILHVLHLSETLFIINVYVRKYITKLRSSLTTRYL